MKPPEKQNKPCSHKGGILYFRGKRCQAHTHNDLWVVHSFRATCARERETFDGWLLGWSWMWFEWLHHKSDPTSSFYFLRFFRDPKSRNLMITNMVVSNFHTHTYHPLKTNKPGKMNHHEPSWTPFIKSKSDGQLLDLSGLAILEFQTSRWSLPPRCGSIPGAMGEVGCWIPIAESTQKSKTDV